MAIPRLFAAPLILMAALTTAPTAVLTAATVPAMGARRTCVCPGRALPAVVPMVVFAPKVIGPENALLPLMLIREPLRRVGVAGVGLLIVDVAKLRTTRIPRRHPRIRR